MKIFTVSAMLALFAIELCAASAPMRAIEARQAPIVEFYFDGPEVSSGGIAHFTQSVPEDGSKVAITNPMVVYSIIPQDTLSVCTFVGADGTVTVISGGQQDIIPETQVSVTCDARSGPIVTPSGFPNYYSYFPSTTVSSATPVSSAIISSATQPSATAAIISSAASTSPPYPIATGSYSVAGISGASASAPSGAAKPTAGASTSTMVPFTGDAVRAVKSFGGHLLAFLGLIAVL